MMVFFTHIPYQPLETLEYKLQASDSLVSKFKGKYCKKKDIPPALEQNTCAAQRVCVWHKVCSRKCSLWPQCLQQRFK